MMQATSLTNLVLHKLSEKPLSGYSLTKEIEAISGQRPSFGSIYPILERLRKEGLVSVRQHGRSKIYTLTAKGKEKSAALHSQRAQLIEEMIRQCRAISNVIGEDPEPVVEIYERLKKGEDPLAPVRKNLLKVRNLIFRMSQDGRLRRHQREVNAVIERSIKELERMQ